MASSGSYAAILLNVYAFRRGFGVTYMGKLVFVRGVIILAGWLMGKRCAVVGCSTTHKNGISLFKFPKDKGIRRQWIRQVQRNRANWTGPSEYSCICSQHFSSDCLESTSRVSNQIGFRMKQMLKPEAVPTIFPTKRSESVPRLRASKAFEKREKLRVSFTNSTPVT